MRRHARSEYKSTDRCIASNNTAPVDLWRAPRITHLLSEKTPLPTHTKHSFVSQTALDYALKLRAEKAAQRRGAAAAGAEEDGQERRAAHPRLAEWKGKVDSRGYRVLKDQVPRLFHLKCQFCFSAWK